MLIHGFPLSAKLPEELGIGERFWYWRGASGRNYIHSIYPADACPPLPGAIFIAVRKIGGERRVVEIGRFSSVLDGIPGGLESSGTRHLPVDEIHVHLLARNDAAANAVLDDLRHGADDVEPALPVTQNFHEAGQLALSLA
jgi:hypothetical protein